MRRAYGSLVMVLALALVGDAVALEWPAPPAEARVRFVRTIDCADLDRDRGFWGSVAGIFGGSDPADVISLPLDVLAQSDRLFMTCQEVPGLLEVDPEGMNYRLHQCDERPFGAPIALVEAGDDILISDSEAGVVFRFRDGEVKPFITEPLLRPTGLACLPEQNRIYVVDTGDHSVKVFDMEGKSVASFGGRGDTAAQMNFPTFAVASGNEILVNDTLNYQIKRFAADGQMVSAFGAEGDSPGAFARAKGVAGDADGHVWVVDSIFDNVQVFSAEGRLLLVLGSRGQGEGQFWSPSGISAHDQKVHIADTFNNRIQILEILGGGS